MRKLSPTEERYINAFPDDLKHKSIEIPGTMQCDSWPKRVSISTVRNMYKMGLIEHSSINFYCCPMKLTEKGKALKNNSNKE